MVRGERFWAGGCDVVREETVAGRGEGCDPLVGRESGDATSVGIEVGRVLVGGGRLVGAA